MNGEALVAFVIFLFPLAYSPGPGNTFFATLGASGGFRAAVPALVGYHVATFIVTLLIGLGVGLTLLAEPHVAKILNVAGALYVLWLGIKFAQAAFASTQSELNTTTDGHASFIDGAIILILNPKAYLIIGLIFTQFMGNYEDKVGHVFSIATIFTVNNLIAFAVWTLAGAAIARLFSGGTSGRGVNIFFSICLIGVALWMFLPVFHT